MIGEGTQGNATTTPDSGAASTGAATTPAASPDAGGAGGSGDAQAAGAAAAAGVDAAAAAAAAAPFNPNFKYKFLAPDGTKAEKEFDDLFKPVIKSPEHEKMLRDIHERAFGLDFVKSEREKIKTEHAALQAEYGPVKQSLQLVGTLLKNKDYDSVFSMLNIPAQDVLQYALGYIERQKDPAKLAEYQEAQAYKQRALAAEMQAAQFAQFHEQTATATRTLELDNHLSRQDIEPIVRSFDERCGRAGAFKAEVIRRGKYYAMTQNVDMPVDKVVGEVLALIGNPAPAALAAQPVAAKPVLPVIQGKGTSPAKRVAKSTADLRKMAQEMTAAQG
jgi:hypothetical protein